MLAAEFADDLELALDAAAFARACELEPDPWQEPLLRSGSPRVLLNACRQAGKATMAAVLALHQPVFEPGRWF